MNATIEQNNPKIFSNNVNSKGMVAPPVPPKSQKAKEAGMTIAAARSKFLNGMIDTSAPKAGEAVSTSKKFKYEVEQSGNLHLGWNIPTGRGLNNLDHAEKKIASAAPKPNVEGKKKVTFADPEKSVISDNAAKHQPTASQYAMQREKEAQESNPFKTLMETMPHLYTREERSSSSWSTSTQSTASSKQPATIDDMLFGGVNDSTPSLEPQRNEAPKVTKQVRFELPEQTTKSPTSTKADSPLDHNPIYQGKRFSTDRFKPKHPSQQIEQPDFTKSGFGKSVKYSPNLEKCMITHSDGTLELERNHKFAGPEASPKHAKADIATCAITKGKGEKGVPQPDASHEAKLPDTVLNQVKDQVKGRVAEIENGSRSC